MNKPFLHLGLAWAVSSAVLLAQPSPESANLRLERAPSPTGPWILLPADELPDSGDGGLVDPASSSEAFYRLRIDLKDPQGGPLGLPLGAVAPAVLEVAMERLDSLRPEEPDWVEAGLAPVVTPIYNPAHREGREPAWFEFKVIPGAAPRTGLNSAPEGFKQSPPKLPELELGYLLVSSGDQDEPVPQYATGGPTPSERLRLLAKTTHLRIVRYSESFWVAENGKGDPLATLGSTPFAISPTALEIAGVAFGVEVEEGKLVSQDEVPPIPTAPFESYDAFRKDYVEGALPKRIREYQAAFGKMEWGVRNEKMPEVVRVPVKEQTIVLEQTRFRSADLDEPIADVAVNSNGGLVILGLVDGLTLLTAVRADGALQLYALVVGDPEQLIQPAGWTSWTTYYGASCAQIPPYDQEWDLAGTCNDGWSGCGPTAWAMFYGYWDNNRGANNLIAGSTPWSNNAAVRDLIGAVFDYCDTWCTAISGQAATNPWDMHDGYRWASERGEGISISSRWSLPYTSSSPRNKAIGAIRDSDRPAIVGTGYLSHYPLAYGYRYRKYRWAGITWDTERQWKVNQGWGSSSCGWVSASGCWFGMNARCY